MAELEDLNSGAFNTARAGQRPRAQARGRPAVMLARSGPLVPARSNGRDSHSTDPA